MLALTRKKGESIIVNNDIEISILELRGDQVKIGISAPREVPVYLRKFIFRFRKKTKRHCQQIISQH